LKLRSAATILGERARGHNDQTVLTPVERSSDVARRIAKGRQPGAGVGVDFDKRSVSIGLIELPRATVTSITAHGLFPCYGDFGRNGSMDKYKLHRERVPVAPNRLGRLIEVVAGAVAALVVVYLLR
jgi:hypothetical protein